MRIKQLLCWLVIGLLASTGYSITQLEITSISTTNYPEINLRVVTDAPNLLLSDFTVTEDGHPVTLLQECFETDSVLVDIAFVVDVSQSMEPKIQAVADGIQTLVDDILAARPQTSFRFALTTYGASSCPATPVMLPVPGYADADAQYYGAPRTYNATSLWSAAQLVAQLNTIAGGNLTGGNEPAYHAIVGTVVNLDWRDGADRVIVLVSDENNDFADDPAMSSGSRCSACGDWPIPYFSQADVITYLQNASVTMHTWTNPNVTCDQYDNGDGIAPENLACQPLQPQGCRAGLTDFGPVALGTGGCAVLMIEPVEPEQVQELFSCIGIDILSRYQICYLAECCVPNHVYSVVVSAEDTDNSTASDNTTYSVASCPGGGGGLPTIYCDPTNPSFFVAGQPYTGCFIATAPSGIDHVSISYQTGVCSGTVPGVPSGGDRYCYTIPGACTNGATFISLDATAYDECGNSTGAECPVVPVNDPTCYDLGDLPNPPYPTNSAISGGPAHAESDIVWLGSSVDCEELCCDDGGGEDNGFTPNCESQGGWSDCAAITVTVHVSVGPGYSTQPLYLSAWYDWNGNGSFTDTYICSDIAVAEWIIHDEIVTPGPNSFLVLASNANGGYVNLRFRIATSPFGPDGYAGTKPNGEVEDYTFYCPPDQECCALCVVDPPQTIGAGIAPISPENVKVVAYVSNGHLNLSWDAVPNAAYYRIYRGSANSSFETMTVAATVPGVETTWMESGSIANLPAVRFYQVQPFVQQLKSGREEDDRGQWEFNEGFGDVAGDQSGYDRHGDLWDDCPPTWGSETIETCDVNYLSFHGVLPNGCPEHVRVANDDVFYQDRFQIWACIRIWDEPTIETGPYYIVSNNSFDINGGGFALRIDPGWFWVDGVREYHNRVTVFVWNQTANGGAGGWQTLQSPPPDPANPGRYSVPLDRWSTICAIVDGPNSMLIIDGYVVAVGDLEYDSENNGAPLIIGAGYRHSTYPIEYPFYGDMDCLRITSLTDEDQGPTYITLTAPNGGQVWGAGSTHEITWVSQNVPSVSIWYSPDSGANWFVLVWSLPNNNSWNWHIPAGLDYSTHARIRVVKQANPWVNDASDFDFTVD